MKNIALILCLSIGLFTNTARANCEIRVLAASVFVVSLVATAGSIIGMTFGDTSPESKTEKSLVFSGSWVVFPYSAFFLVGSGVALVASQFSSMKVRSPALEIGRGTVADPVLVHDSSDDSMTSISLGDT